NATDRWPLHADPRLGRRLRLGTRFCDSKRCCAGLALDGRSRLATTPLRTGSSPIKNTIGIVVVAARAASAAAALALATITDTFRAPSAAASPGSRSYCPSAH